MSEERNTFNEKILNNSLMKSGLTWKYEENPSGQSIGFSQSWKVKFSNAHSKSVFKSSEEIPEIFQIIFQYKEERWAERTKHD